MRENITKTLLALVVAFSVISTFGIGVASADTHLPHEEAEIDSDVSEIDYEITAVSDYSAVDGDDGITEVSTDVTIVGVDEDGDETEVYSETYEVTEDSVESGMFEPSETETSDYESFTVTIDTADDTERDYIDSVSVNSESESESGSGVAIGEDSILYDNVFGVPAFAWLVLIGVGVFVYSNSNDDF